MILDDNYDVCPVCHLPYDDYNPCDCDVDTLEEDEED